MCQVSAHRRRIRAKAGPPAALTLAAPIRSTAGYALTLTAFVTDKNYAPVDTELSLRFYDGEDKLLGEAPVVPTEDRARSWRSQSSRGRPRLCTFGFTQMASRRVLPHRPKRGSDCKAERSNRFQFWCARPAAHER
jgi:hypothetical protein